MKTPEQIIKDQLIRYVDSYQVGDGANTVTTAILAALGGEGYALSGGNACLCAQRPAWGIIECPTHGTVNAG